MALLDWIKDNPSLAFWIAVVGTACLCSILLAIRGRVE